MPTVLHRLSKWADETPNEIAQRYKKNGQWESLTTKEFRDRVFHMALYLESQGFKAEAADGTGGDIFCILAYNSPEWVHCDLAAMLLRGKSAGIYPNSTTKDIHYVLNHTEASVLAVQNKDYYQKILAQGREVPASIGRVIVFDGDTSVNPKAIAYSEALLEGERIAKTSGKRVDDYLNRLDPHAPAFIIYTSGTTGNPKGALLSHDNLVFTADAISHAWKLPYGDGSLFSFLPLCHIAEKLQNLGVGISQRYCVSFCTRMENTSVELPEVQPTLLLSVPRLWEKMMEGVLSKVRRSSGIQQRLATWALSVGARVAEAKYAGKFPNPVDLIQLEIADRLVLRKVRHAMGLGEAVRLASGAAALAAHISRWFRALRLEILEDFGQTESTGVICVTEIGVESAGTVGKPIEGSEFKIAEDGEIMVRGRQVFKGYFKDDAATAATMEDGWLHTGDLGEINERGLVRIKGRKKEILKTSGGKMVAPLPIEETLKAATIISQVCIVGDGRKYLSALITLSEETLKELKGRPGALDTEVVRDESILKEVKGHVDGLNKGLASFEKIKRFAVLSREFSIADGEMTPTLKMKRNVIETRFRVIIDDLYGNAGSSGAGD